MRRVVLCLLLVAGALAPSAGLASPALVRDGGAYAGIDGPVVRLGNDDVERRFLTAPAFLSSMRDVRTGLLTAPQADFSVELAGGRVDAGAFTVERAEVRARESGGVEAVFELSLGALSVRRTYAVFDGVGGFEVRTELRGAGAITGYTLDAVRLPGAAPAVQAFRAGYDWRGSDTPDWEPSLSPFGGHHSGDHRVETAAGPGEPLEAGGEWLSLDAGGPRAFMVLQRVNYASSRMAFDGEVGRAAVDLSRDLLYMGPFESDVHLGNPGVPGRARIVRPGRPVVLETVFTGLALDADDEPWQHFRYLDRRWTGWRRGDVVFNSNGVDANRISTGAKDDMDHAEVVAQAEVAKRIGVETFVLDDGWQAVSGDWCPDSEACPEPRGRWPHRFLDDHFAAVREVIAPMRLGLWMSPMHFHPASAAYARNPSWNCEPVGEALVAVNRAQPDSGSNEAGIGTWNPEALGPDGRLIDHVERRIRHAIDVWGVEYFKFDFLVWLDCAGVDSVTAYEYRESFVAMLDRLQADHPAVTFQIDETNDYRLFPFESVARGPSWYANGHPTADQALHNLWMLNPWVPGFTLGQDALGRPLDAALTASLGSHLTLFRDLTRLTGAEVDATAAAVTLYKQHRDRFAGFTYPLLDDPLGGTSWTALQPWDPDAGRGALLVFRQDAPEPSRVVALRGVRGDGRFRLTDARTGGLFGEFSASELRGGIEVALPAGGTLVLLVDPA